LGGLSSHLRSALGRLALVLVALGPLVAVLAAFRDSQNLAWYLLGLALLCFGGMLMYLENVSAPLRRMSEASRRFANGDFSALVEETGPSDARAMAHSLNQMAQALALRYDRVDKTVKHSQEVLIALEMLAREQSEEVAGQNVELKAQAVELREHREVLAAQNQVLLAQNDALQRASRHKSEFLANMSHELRTPLNAVIGFSEMLIEDIAGPLGGEQREFVEDILRSGRHLLTMINDILDLAKIEAGRMELRQERVDLAVAAREAEEMARSLVLRKGLTLELRADQSVFCLGDAQRLRQVALNLFSNAVKFTPEGGRITCEVRPSDDGLFGELLLSDTGIGIHPSNHEAIFEQFRQVDSGHAREFEGTGLGLALVRQFAEAMGGQVTVRSQLGEGATFTVRIPRDTSSVARPLASPVKVVVAADASAPRERLQRLLREAGYQVTALEPHGLEGGLGPLTPDALVLDLARPSQGVKLLQQQDSALPTLVLVSPEASEEDVAHLRRLGAEVVLQTVAKSELIAVMERMLSRGSTQRAA